MSIKALIFDLDGLVLDSESTYVDAWRQAAATMGYDLNDDVCRSLSGMHGGAVSERLQQHFGRQFELETFQRLSTELWHMRVEQTGIPVKKGFFSLMNFIRRIGLPFCLATNSRRLDAQRCLALAGLDQVFSHIVTREDVPLAKPNPDIFIAAAAIFGFRAADCLVLEDSPIGVAAAVAAGTPCLYLPSLKPADREVAKQALAVLDDLEQAACFIAQMLDLDAGT